MINPLADLQKRIKLHRRSMAWMVTCMLSGDFIIFITLVSATPFLGSNGLFILGALATVVTMGVKLVSYIYMQTRFGFLITMLKSMEQGQVVYNKPSDREYARLLRGPVATALLLVATSAATFLLATPDGWPHVVTIAVALLLLAPVGIGAFTAYRSFIAL